MNSARTDGSVGPVSQATQLTAVLSGTPVQNDLGEYWAMANFVCPGVMGIYSQFQKQYENPIVRARAANCTQAVAEKGKQLSKEVSIIGDA